MSPAEPETKRAILPHARTGVPIWHRYLATVECTVPGFRYREASGEEQEIPAGPGYQHLYESEDPEPAHRALRVWGCDGSRREEPQP
jgi:hypothetical protein